VKPSVRHVGMVWYREADYPRILGVMNDAHVLPRTHGEWREKAEAGRRDLESKGFVVVLAIIDPQTFPAWCRARSLNVNAEARAAFANEIAIEAVKKMH